MKLKMTLLLSIFVIGGTIYAQNNTGIYLLDKCINLLDKPVPNEFRRSSRTVFQNDEGIFLITENDIVIIASLGFVSSRTNETAAFTALFYNFFENNDWTYIDSRSDSSGDVYSKNGIYAVITKPSRRDDGLIGAGVMFSSDVNNFY